MPDKAKYEALFGRIIEELDADFPAERANLLVFFAVDKLAEAASSIYDAIADANRKESV